MQESPLYPEIILDEKTCIVIKMHLCSIFVKHLLYLILKKALKKKIPQKRPGMAHIKNYVCWNQILFHRAMLPKSQDPELINATQDKSWRKSVTRKPQMKKLP